MSNDGTQGEGKKSLDLDRLDKVVGGAGIMDILKGPKNAAQQVADTLAEIEAAKAKALAPTPTPPLPATDASVKSMDTEIGKLSARATVDDIAKVVKANPAAAVHGLSELAKTNPNAMASLEGMARVNTKGALSALESLARAKAPGAFEALGDVALGKMSKGANDMVKALIQASPTTAMPGILASTGSAWGVLEKLGKTVPEAKPFLEKMASNGAGMALSVLDKIGDQAFIAKLAKDGGNLATNYVLDRLGGGNAFYQNLAEELLRSGGKNALLKIEELANKQNGASWTMLDKLAHANVKPAIQALEDLAAGGPAQVRALTSLQQLSAEGSSTALSSLEALVKKGAAPVTAVEELARHAVTGAYQALDRLAGDGVQGALGAMSRVMQGQLDDVRGQVEWVLNLNQNYGQAGVALENALRNQTDRLASALNLDAGTASSMVKGQIALYLQEKMPRRDDSPFGMVLSAFDRREAEKLQPLVSYLGVRDVSETVKGLSMIASMGGDPQKCLSAITDMVSKQADQVLTQAQNTVVRGGQQIVDTSQNLDLLNKANAAVEQGQEMAKKTRIGAAIFNVADNPTDEEAYKRLIAEGALMAATPSSVSKAIHAVGAFDKLAYCAAAGEVFDRAGIGSEVRQAAKAMSNVVENLQNAFVDVYTKAVLDPAFDMATHAGENCYALGKAIASGNITDIGNSMGTLAYDLTKDYVNSVKTYYMAGGEAALNWSREVMMGFMNDTGATKYAYEVADIGRGALNELSDLAQRGSMEAVKEIANLANTTGQFAQDAANQLVNVYYQLPPGLRGPVGDVIGGIVSFGSPAASFLQNVVGGGIVSGANQVKDWGESAVNWVGDNLKFW